MLQGHVSPCWQGAQIVPALKEPVLKWFLSIRTVLAKSTCIGAAEKVGRMGRSRAVRAGHVGVGGRV